jgi:hypothetical protein
VNRKLIVLMAVSIVVGGFALACCGDLFGGKDKEGPEITIPNIEIPGGPTVKSGTLSGPGDSESFDINTTKDYLEVTYTWPSDASFWVKVIGQDGSVLGDFDLANGEVIQLYGGGKFTLNIYSVSGSGAWTATYTP